MVGYQKDGRAQRVSARAPMAARPRNAVLAAEESAPLVVGEGDADGEVAGVVFAAAVVPAALELDTPAPEDAEVGAAELLSAREAVAENSAPAAETRVTCWRTRVSGRILWGKQLTYHGSAEGGGASDGVGEVLALAGGLNALEGARDKDVAVAETGVVAGFASTEIGVSKAV